VVFTTGKEAERIIKDDGWYFFKAAGAHYHYYHPTKPGKVTIPRHSGKDLRIETVKSIMKQAGLK
jgi:predicted RNA binding protein YcfA (HicA-like mRNA interferase family)